MIRFVVTFSLLLGLTTLGYAGVVHIPDPNLEAALREALQLPHGEPITREAMLQLTQLDVISRGIADLMGLEFAKHLRWLSIAYNPITDLTPIAGLNKLEVLYLWATPVSNITPVANLTNLREFRPSYCDITDISPIANLLKLHTLALDGNEIADITPLANLTQLEYLNLSANNIVDASPLANLTLLRTLRLDNNAISDVRPLAGLTALQTLHIDNNRIINHSPLDGLTLTEFTYDQTCDMPPLPLQPRLGDRSFPSVFTAWGGLGWSSVLNQPHLSDLEQMAQHDLYWCCLMFGGDFVDVGDAVEIRGSLDSMVQVRDDYIAQNPNMIFLAGLNAVWEDLDTFSPDSDYWLRDEQGEILPAWDMGLVNLNHPEVQKRIIERVVAVSKCGFYDGVFFDGWAEWGRHRDGTIQGTEAILKGIRERVHDNFLILVNTNTHTAPVSSPYINGLFLESLVPEHWDDPAEGFRRLENTLSWAETNLRAPQINALEGWAYEDEPLDSPNNLRWMRAITTLGLTFSDGYVLFMTGMWEGVHMHWHYWYDFWNADLGRPIGETLQLYKEREGLYIREFTNGWAVYNHSGSAQIVTLPEEVQSAVTGFRNTDHAVLDLDGDIFLRVEVTVPGDLNGDGSVTILDLIIVAEAMGTDKREADVNGDGVVNVFDLVFVADQF